MCVRQEAGKATDAANQPPFHPPAVIAGMLPASCPSWPEACQTICPPAWFVGLCIVVYKIMPTIAASTADLMEKN